MGAGRRGVVVTWRLRIAHDSGYQYEGVALASYNEARIVPLTTDRQLVLEATVSVTPSSHSARPYRYWDYWGTVVHVFDVHTRHTELTVAGRSLVETSEAQPVTDCEWAALDDPNLIDRFSELLAPTGYVPGCDGLGSVVAQVRHAPSPAAAVHEAVEWARNALAYGAGATHVHTTALEALDGGLGVCQDFAHLTLLVLRAAGIPSRYASGYFYSSEDGRIGQTVTGESHAWVEAWTGGWWGIDPTNGVHVGERHVLVARARDYADVPPLKGIYIGGASQSLGVTVHLTRVS
jgi:transglutaminase-like putative cysteine protease